MEWEIFSEKIVGFSAEIEGGKLKFLRKLKDHAFAVRVIENNKVGFSSGKNLEKTIEEAKKIARISEEELKEFPVEKPARVEKIYDRRFENPLQEFIKDEYEILINSVEKAKIANALISHEVVEIELKNSFGAELREKGSFSFFSIETVYEEGSGFAQTGRRELELEIESTARYAEELAIKASKAEKLNYGYYDIVLMPHAVHQLFSNTLYPSFSAENVARGRSSIHKGMYLGELKILDDPTLPGGFVSFSFDDEGVMARKKVLLDREVLGFYSDWKNSKKFGVSGNGLRIDIDSPPMPLPSNIIVEIDEEVEVESALIVHNFIGSHTTNPISGDFSVECLNAEIDGRAFKGVMIYGNIFDFLKKIRGFCLEKVQIENTISPAIRFEKIKVI
ncbi:MAG: TldD/PmbA family protein [Archaeoglobaceae archaeon]|nr:TldD/PmbA family protein [Archaeoglobaceae archaeon]MDW7990059.1 TldD/PmbA family protein [Archaeoglobaceae archaeon]